MRGGLLRRGLILLSATCLAGAACVSAESTTPADSQHTTRPQFSPATSWNPDALMADLAKEVPGFAGYTVDRQRGILNIRATSPGFNAEALRAAMRKRQPAIDPSLLELEFKVIAAHWDYADLNEWYIQAQDAIFPLPTQYF
jgi:hypothetical protein